MITASSIKITRLSAAGRIQLAQDIWDTVAAHPDAVALSKAQTEELGWRLADYQRSSQAGTS